jgi:hypothetical protein
VDGRDKPAHDAVRATAGPRLGLRIHLINSYRHKSREFSANCLSNRLSNRLDKIRNMRYVLLLTESLPARRLPGPGDEKPRLFENLPDHNPLRELQAEADFSI